MLIASTRLKRLQLTRVPWYACSVARLAEKGAGGLSTKPGVKVVEADVLVVGSGVAGAMVATKLSEQTTGKIVVADVGRFIPRAKKLLAYSRHKAYREDPYFENVVGGMTVHWDGIAIRFTPEDFRAKSRLGIGMDWPLSYEELEPAYQEVEERLGVSGVSDPGHPRSKPYPMPPRPMNYSSGQLREWLRSIGFNVNVSPYAINSQPYDDRSACLRCDTCRFCPTGAKYSADQTIERLIGESRIELYPDTLIYKLEHEANGSRIQLARGLSSFAPYTETEFRAKVFVVAGGFRSANLLKSSASNRYPDGLANSSSLVGRYYSGHPILYGGVDVPRKLYAGQHNEYKLYTSQFLTGPDENDVRFDLKFSVGRGKPMFTMSPDTTHFGNDMIAAWRNQLSNSKAFYFGYYEIFPEKEAGLMWGDGSI